MERIEQHILARYEVIKKIGRGAYGHVWKVRDKTTSEHVALKKIFDAFQHETDAKRTYRQIDVLKQLNHPNIVKLLRVHKSENNKDVYLVFELMDADLSVLIIENMLEEVHKKYVVYQMALALNYMHSGGAIHRDIKPTNILVNTKCFIKLCDFGLVRILPKKTDKVQEMTENVATRWYRSPELLLGLKKYTSSVDIWSLGCIIGELYGGSALFQGQTNIDQLSIIASYVDVPKVESSSKQSTLISMLQKQRKESLRSLTGIENPILLDLLQKCLQFRPDKRPTAQEILNHPFLTQFLGVGQHTTATQEFTAEQGIHNLSPGDIRHKLFASLDDKSKSSRRKILRRKSDNPYRHLHTEQPTSTDLRNESSAATLCYKSKKTIMRCPDFSSSYTPKYKKTKFEFPDVAKEQEKSPIDKSIKFLSGIGLRNEQASLAEHYITKKSFN